MAWGEEPVARSSTKGKQWGTHGQWTGEMVADGGRREHRQRLSRRRGGRARRGVETSVLNRSSAGEGRRRRDAVGRLWVASRPKEGPCAVETVVAGRETEARVEGEEAVGEGSQVVSRREPGTGWLGFPNRGWGGLLFGLTETRNRDMGGRGGRGFGHGSFGMSQGGLEVERVIWVLVGGRGGEREDGDGWGRWGYTVDGKGRVAVLREMKKQRGVVSHGNMLL